jgi:hypothetical protein
MINAIAWNLALGSQDWTDQHLFVKPLFSLSGYPSFRHLEAAYHIFVYLKKHPDMGKLAYDSHAPAIDEPSFTQMPTGQMFTGTSLKNYRPTCLNCGDIW